MQTEPATRTWLELQAPSSSASILTLDTAESGDAFDAEVDQFSGEQMDDGISSSSHAIECRYLGFGLLIHVPRRLPKEKIL